MGAGHRPEGCSRVLGQAWVGSFNTTLRSWGQTYSSRHHEGPRSPGETWVNIWMTVSPRMDTQSKGHPEMERTMHGNTETSGFWDGLREQALDHTQSC